MPITIGVDLGTTSITALAVDTASGELLACCTTQSDAETTSPSDKARGWSEWDARRVTHRALGVLKAVAVQAVSRGEELAGLCVTGQQHGVLLVDANGEPAAPFINWQDRRTEAELPDARESYLARAVALAGPEAPSRAGCVLSAGYMGATLFWLKERHALPAGATACFLADYLGGVLAARRPVTDPTDAASSGVFDVSAGRWDEAVIGALGLPAGIFPEVRQSGDPLGTLCAPMAAATGLPEGLPLFVGLGDNQASFLGSVANRADSVLVNIGTGSQVAAYCDEFVYAPPAETRPFPRGGYLLVNAGLTGGRSYSILEGFFRRVGDDVLGVEPEGSVYTRMAELARRVPHGADGMRCEPYFAGSRAEPERRAVWSGVSVANFTPAHMARALLEGMARASHEGYEGLRAMGAAPCRRLVGAGNGLRMNPVLAQIVGEEFSLRLAVPRHREEAAFGAALLAACGAGVFPDLESAGRVIRYETGEG